MSAGHKPYAPTVAGLGLSPNNDLDVPVTSVFLILFLFGAICHMTILQLNLRRGQKFIMSGLLFGFCMARVTACTMRLVWSQHLRDVSIAIAAQIFVAAGVVILFVVNIIFAQRILRASHPHFGWHKSTSWAFKLYISSIVLVIIVLIIAVVQSFYTRDTNILRIDRDIQRFGGTYFAVSAFLPIVLVALGFVIPRYSDTDNFGSGHFKSKIWILLFASALLTTGAAFRAGISFMPRPINNPAWYHSKACFYLFDFTIEWIVVALYVIIRVDKRFIVPDHAHGPGDYSRKTGAAGQQQPEQQTVKPKLNRMDSILSEEEVFDGQPAGNSPITRVARRRVPDLEAQNLKADDEEEFHTPAASPISEAGQWRGYEQKMP
jgi:hypothetical protein